MSNRLLTIAGVEAVLVDPETKGVTVHGQGLDFVTLRGFVNAGYQAA
jgi:hypothetical protein